MRRLADENFNNDILRSLRQLNPTIDIVRAQDEGLTGVDDAGLLAWSAERDRIVLTHDVTTLTGHAYDRASQGKRMPGILEVSRRLPIRSVTEDILLLDECSLPEDWESQVRYLPLR